MSGLTTRVDMHCHSSASQRPLLGVQRAVGLPECATPPEEVYGLAKRRGMDFVTITDHDTIDGVLRIADRPDVFVSEELTAHFRGEPQAVHVLCYDISATDHEYLQANRGDVEICASYLHDREIVCALAHPYYAVGAPLTARHRRRLAQMFDVWEVRNGSRAKELNRPADTYVATLDSIGIGGSDDHGGVDIGRTWTEAPLARTPQEFLDRIRAGHGISAGGAQGSAAKWAHSAIALAARSVGYGDPRGDPSPPDPLRVMTMVRRVLHEGEARHGAVGSDLSPKDARCLLRAWLTALGLDHLDERGLIDYMQGDQFSHSDLYRRACRVHERKLRLAVEHAVATATGRLEIAPAAIGVFEGCIAAIPYAPATAFLARERDKLSSHEDRETARVAILADGIGSPHGVTRTIEEIRQRGVPGFEIEVIGTDPDVDRRLPAVAELELPFYPGLRIGVPSLPVAAQTLTEGGFDLVHVCSPGPAGIAGALLGRALGLPLVGSYHTELTTYAALRSGEPRLAEAMAFAVATFYNACDLVLSPSPFSDQALAKIGLAPGKVIRWDRGVDSSRFDPNLRDPDLLGASSINVLYAGRITREKGAELLVESFRQARRHDPRLHLVLAGDGPEREWVGRQLGESATFLGWLEGAELARVYASADIFLFPSTTDTFGQVILEAQASGLAVLAVAEGGPLNLVRDGVTGMLREACTPALVRGLVELAGAPALRKRLAATALARVRERTWERALGRLATGYRHALGDVERRGSSATGNLTSSTVTSIADDGRFSSVIAFRRMAG